MDTLSYKTVSLNKATVNKEWLVIDATDLVLGRLASRVALAKRHFGLSLDLKGPVTGVFEMRRHLSCYFKGLPGFKETRIKLVTSKDPEEILRTLDYVAERWGEEAPEAESAYGI